MAAVAAAQRMLRFTTHWEELLTVGQSPGIKDQLYKPNEESFAFGQTRFT